MILRGHWTGLVDFKLVGRELGKLIDLGIFSVVEIEPRALHLLGKYTLTSHIPTPGMFLNELFISAVIHTVTSGSHLRVLYPKR